MSATKPTGKIPPKPGKETVYVDVDDEITAIIDKVDSAKEKVVALVLPKRSTALQSIVNMRLLRRSADGAGKSVVLITHEEALLPLAGAAGLHVAESLQGKPEVPPSPRAGAPEPTTKDIAGDNSEIDADNAKLDYHRSIGELAGAGAADEAEEIALGDEDKTEDEEKSKKADKKPKAAKIKVPNFDRFRLLLGLGVLGIILLIVFIVLAVAVLPKATITIQTTSLPVSANLTLTASNAVQTLDEPNNALPAVLKSSDQTSTESVQATGQQNNGTKATGSVSITNCSQDGSEIDIPAGTGVSSGGLTYITQSELDLPNSAYFGSCKNNIPNTSGSVNIVAQTAGTKYNLASSPFVVSGYTSDTSASGSASGGTDSIITVVSQADINSAQNKVAGDVGSTFTKSFETSLSNQGAYVLTSTVKAATPVITATPALGQQASTVTVTIKTTYTVLTVQKSDLQKIITDTLTKQVNKSQQRLNTNNVLGDATVTVQSLSSPTVATLSVNESTTAVPILDVATIKKQSAGQKVGDIDSSINNLAGVKTVTVKLSPFWVSKAPKASKITVVQKQVTGSGN